MAVTLVAYNLTELTTDTGPQCTGFVNIYTGLICYNGITRRSIKDACTRLISPVETKLDGWHVGLLPAANGVNKFRIGNMCLFILFCSTISCIDLSSHRLHVCMNETSVVNKNKICKVYWTMSLLYADRIQFWVSLNLNSYWLLKCIDSVTCSNICSRILLCGNWIITVCT
jgi:hypothetical protein